MLDPQNRRCRSLIRRAYFELIVTALALFCPESRLPTGDAAKAHPPAAPFRAKPLTASGAAYVIAGAALQGIKTWDISHGANKLLWPRSRPTSRRGFFLVGGGNA
jgi:hypothetical protein